MKRISTWFLSTVTLVVLMFGYHTSTSSVLSTKPAGGITSSGTGAAASSTGRKRFRDREWQQRRRRHGHRLRGADPVGPGPGRADGQRRQDHRRPGRQYPSGNPPTQEINSYALPVLIQETLDAQSAHIDMVSGATVTSVGYLQSLQSALDQAGL